MKEVSVLVGGKAGDGINNAGAMVAQLFNHLGYFVYIYIDYPSLIRGGHNFALVRAADEPIGAYNDRIDYLVALNQETLDLHLPHCPDCTVIANADLVKSIKSGQTVSINTILKAESAPPITGNSVMIGAFAKAAGIPWEIVGDVFRRHMPKAADENIRVARRAYDEGLTTRPIPAISGPPHTLLSGNEAIGLGLVAGGLSAYISYPMTPSSTLLHFLAGNAERFGLKVIHPENEIAVILMALGSATAGARTAVGTSGGGFCLMTEGLSFAGMAEIPIVIVVSQRTGPSTGLPTYTGQADSGSCCMPGKGSSPGWSWRLPMPGRLIPGLLPRCTLPGNTRSRHLCLPTRPCPKGPTASTMIGSPGCRWLIPYSGTGRHPTGGTATPRPASPLSRSRAGKMPS